MNIITATQVLQASADKNGRSFSDEVWALYNKVRRDDPGLYDAYHVWLKEAGEFVSKSAEKARVEQLARDVDNLKKYNPESFEILSSLLT